MAKVKDNVTGQIFQVPDEQLGQYGLSSPVAQPVQYQQPQQDPSILQGNLKSQNLLSGNDLLANIINSISRPAISTLQNILSVPLSGELALNQATGGKLFSGVPLKSPFLSDTKLNQIQDNPTQFIGDQAKNSAALASYAVPFGKGANLITKGVLPGAVVGAAQSLPEAKNAEDVVRSGLTGGIAGGAVEGLMSLLGLGGNATKNVGKFVENQGNQMRQGVNKITEPASIYGASREKAVQNTLDDLGITGSAQQKYEQLLPKYQQLSDNIESSLSSNPKNIPIAQIKRDLETNLSKNLTLDINGKKASDAVDSFIQNIYKSADPAAVVPTDISTPELFALKQNINKDYGTIASKLQNGTPLSDTEKVIYQARKTIDDLITNAHPDVKQMTTMQSHLYDAADSLNRSRKTVPTYRMFGTTIPTPVQQKAQDLIGSTTQNVGKNIQSAGNIGNLTTNPVLNNILGQSASRFPGFINSVSNQGQNPNANINATPNNENSSGNLNHGSQYTTQNNANQITPEMVAAAQLYLPPQLSERVKAAYQSQYGNATTQQVGLVKSGLKNINDVEQMLKEDPQLLAKQLLPGKLASRKFDSAIYDAADALLRLRTGAQANPSEIKAYAQSIAPSLGDSPDAVAYKIAKLRSDLQSYLGQ